MNRKILKRYKNIIKSCHYATVVSYGLSKVLSVLKANAKEFDRQRGNELVSYTCQMDLERIGDQAKFKNASLRKKHFKV